MFNWIVSDIQQYLESFNFVDMLNWIVWNRTVWSFNSVKKDWSLVELIVLNSNTWKHLTVYKQMINSK